MVQIMNKARINYSSLKIVDDIGVELKEETRTFFDKLISDFRTNDSSQNGVISYIQFLFSRNLLLIIFNMHLIFNVNNYDLLECYITDQELQTLRDKTHRQLRLRELLLENSSQSTLVVMYV